jgi:hypothetical protein
MTTQGNAMMAADQAKNAASAASEGAKEAVKAGSEGTKETLNVGSNIDLVSKSNGMLDSSGKINYIRIAELAKENKIPGFDFNDYAKGRNPGWVDTDDIFNALAKNPTYGEYFNLDNMNGIEIDEAKGMLEQFLKKAGRYWINVE